MGSGVACFIHNTLRTRFLECSPSAFSNSPEYIILDISSLANTNHTVTHSLLLAIIYRRPKAKFFCDFVHSFERFAHNYENIVIIGDLNCDLLSTNSESIALNEFINSQSLFLVPSEATHHSLHCDSWLDVVILDSNDKLINYTKSTTPFIAGHDSISVTLNLTVPPPQPRQLLRRMIKHFDSLDFQASLRSTLSSLPSMAPSSPDLLDEFISNFSRSVTTTFDTHAPLRSFTVSKPPTPWLTGELKRLLKERNSLYQRSKRSNNPLALVIYRRVRDISPLRSDGPGGPILGTDCGLFRILRVFGRSLLPLVSSDLR